MLSSVLFLLLVLLTSRYVAPSPANFTALWAAPMPGTATNVSERQASANDSLWRFANVTSEGASAQLGDRLLKLPRMQERPFDPLRVMLSVGSFLRKLGAKKLDEKHLSVEPPEAPFRDRALVLYPLLRVPNSVRQLVRRFMRRTFGHNRRRHKDLALTLKRYLANYSVCPVKYRWHDLGPRFWPRWARLGSCLNREHSCSLPPGMHCRPAQLRKVKVLRYVCPLAWLPHQCDWRPIVFTVVVSCSCSC